MCRPQCTCQCAKKHLQPKMVHPRLIKSIMWSPVKSKKSREKTCLDKFPKVKRDLALLIDDSLRFDQLQEVARQAASKLLKEVSLFDVYEGKELPVGKKSYALSFILEDRHKTLTDKQIDHTMGKITKALVDAFNVELR